MPFVNPFAAFLWLIIFANSLPLTSPWKIAATLFDFTICCAGNIRVVCIIYQCQSCPMMNARKLPGQQIVAGPISLSFPGESINGLVAPAKKHGEAIKFELFNKQIEWKADDRDIVDMSEEKKRNGMKRTCLLTQVQAAYQWPKPSIPFHSALLLTYLLYGRQSGHFIFIKKKRAQLSLRFWVFG